MKPKQNLFHLMFKELNDGSSAIFSLMTGRGLPHLKSKSSGKTFNYVDLMGRKNAALNKA